MNENILNMLKNIREAVNDGDAGYVGFVASVTWREFIEWIDNLTAERDRLAGELAELKERIEDDLDDLQFAKNGLKAVQGLIEESRGICGLHLNGDEAPWDELRTGGRFEEWLLDFDKAIEKLFPIAGKEGAE